MSTDDLTRRARAEVPTFGLMSELADEVDRLRAERGRAYKAGLQDRDAEWDRQQDYYEVSLAAQERVLTAERDAARAALERVRDRDALAALIASVDGLAVDAGGKVDGFHYDAADAILNALEGES